MKAVIVRDLGEPDVLSWEDRPVPEPGRGEVLVRVTATSVNFADIKARRGQYHGAGEPPFIPGLDAAGLIEKVGPGVESLTTGMRVAVFPKAGSYAEYVVADQMLVYPLPDAISWEAAAALPTVGFTAYTLLTQVGQLTPGESILIHAAAGGVGTTAVQLARLLGANRVIGTVSRPDKRAAVEAMGAEVIEYGDGHFADAVNDMTNGRGVDVVLDSIGGSVSEESLHCLAHFGRLVHFGSASGQPGHIRVSDLHASCRSARGYSLGTTRVERPQSIAPTARAVLELAAEKRLVMQIGRHYPLAEAAEAHRWMESRESIGKIILDVNNPGLKGGAPPVNR